MFLKSTLSEVLDSVYQFRVGDNLSCMVKKLPRIYWAEPSTPVCRVQNYRQETRGLEAVKALH